MRQRTGSQDYSFEIEQEIPYPKKLHTHFYVGIFLKVITEVILSIINESEFFRMDMRALVAGCSCYSCRDGLQYK
jgi:hypothetical protein